MADLNTNWPTRLDHYMNLTKNKIDWQQLAITNPVIFLCTITVALVVKSALNKDSQVLDHLRSTYRQRWRRARLFIHRDYNTVARGDIDSRSILKREVAWKKLSGDVFRKP